MTTQELIAYYANLLILQYVGKPKAYGSIQTLVSGIVMDQLPAQVKDGFNLNPTVQRLVFSDVAVGGSFTLRYGSLGTTSSIAYNTPLDTLPFIFESLLGINEVTITGDLSTQLTLAFTIKQAPSLFVVETNTLVNGASDPVEITVLSNIAVGVQLDVLGKYAGVSRSGFGSSGPITLDDADFYRLIQLAIISNNSGSSLAEINSLLATYFPDEILVFDYANTDPMRMGYYISTALGSQDLIQLFIAEGLLPKPMGVQLGVAGAPTITNFYGFTDYTALANQSGLTPFNCNSSYTLGAYNTNWLWLDYTNAL